MSDLQGCCVVGRRGAARTIVIALVLVGGAVGAGAYVMRSDGGSGVDAQTTELYRVSETSFDITVKSSGELEAKNQTKIRSELESQAAITEVVAEGTFIKKGELLVQLNDEALRRQRDEELLRVESARSELVSAENSFEIQQSENAATLRQAELKLELAQIELRKWTEGDKIKREQELLLKKELADRRLDQADEKFEEMEKLFAKTFASREELRNAENAQIQARADVKTAELDTWIFETYEDSKQIKKLSSDVNEAEAEFKRVEGENSNRLASKEAIRTNTRRQLAVKEERLTNLDEQLTNTTIYAPTDGLVVYATSVGRGRGFMMMGGDGPIQVGRNVRPNETIIFLPETGQMVASVRVHESLAGRVRPGIPANITIDAAPGITFRGAVDSIGVLAETDGWRDPNLREYTVKVLLDSAQDISMLKPSMRAEAEIILGSVEQARAIPLQAVFREGPIAFVYTPRGGRFERTPVALGRRSSAYIEILSGLEDDAQVLLREPEPGEVFEGEFDEEQLATLAGFSMQGAHASGGRGMRGGKMGGGKVMFQSGDAGDGVKTISKEDLDKLLKGAVDDEGEEDGEMTEEELKDLLEEAKKSGGVMMKENGGAGQGEGAHTKGEPTSS